MASASPPASPAPGAPSASPPATAAPPEPSDNAAAVSSPADPVVDQKPAAPGASEQQDVAVPGAVAGQQDDVGGAGNSPVPQEDNVAVQAPEQQGDGAAGSGSGGDAHGGDGDTGGAAAPRPSRTSRSRSTSPITPSAKRLKPDPEPASPRARSAGDGATEAPESATKKGRYPVAADGDDAGADPKPSSAAGAADEASPLPRLSPEAETGLAEIFETGACSPSDVNGRVREYLASLPDSTARAAIADLATRDFSSVRNRPAFVMSCVKKAAAAALPSATPGAAGSTNPVASVPPSALAHLPGPVGEGLQRVFATGVCHPSQFDDRAMDILVELPTHAAVRALSEFAAVPPSRVRNPSAFWMGLARKHKSAVAAAALAPQTMPNMGYGPPPMAQPYGAAPAYGQPMHHQPPPSYDYHQVHQQPAYGGYDYGAQYGHTGYGPPQQVVGGGVQGGYYDSRPPPVATGMGGVAPSYGTPGCSRVASRVDALVAARVVRPGDVDARAIEALGRLREADALAALDELAAAEPSRVRNPSAYVMGLARKYAAASAAAYPNADGGDGSGAGGNMSGHGGGAAAGSAGGGSLVGGGLWNTMDPRVREKYENLVLSGVLPSVAFDSRAVAALAGLSPADGIASLDELAASDPTRVRNLSAYYMGVARKFAARLPEGR